MIIPKIKFVRLDERAVLPSRVNDLDAGIDLYALEDVEIYPGDTVKVRTGVSMEMPEEWDTPLSVAMAHIEDRSSVGSKGLSHTAGVVDFGYNKGEIIICITNLRLYEVLNSLRIITARTTGIVKEENRITFDFKPYTIKSGDKIAQIVLQPVYKGKPIWTTVDKLQDRSRGANGFGSSDLKNQN